MKLSLYDEKNAQISKKDEQYYARNHRFSTWQRNKCLRENARILENVNKMCSSGYLKGGEVKAKPLTFKTNKIDLHMKKNPPQMIQNKDKQWQHLKCHEISVNTNENKINKDNGFNSKKKISPQKNENRIKYSIDGEDDIDLNNSVTLFQTMLRGRAYQTMMMIAKIRYQAILHSAEGSLKLDTTNKFKEITSDDILEYSKNRHISRFFNTLSNESILRNSENKINKLIQQANSRRNAIEMVERKRRQAEITGRIVQDKIFKQILKVHENVSVVYCEKLIEEAIQQSAKEESLNATTKNEFYNIESNKNIEKELLSKFVIPEAHRVINYHKIIKKK